MLVYLGLTFLMPILSIRLKEFEYSTVYIGLAFAIPTLCYAIASTCVFQITKALSKRTTIFMGLFLMSLSLFMIGPSTLIGFVKEDTMILIGLGIMGVGAGMIIIPVMPEMIEAIEQDPKFDYDEEDLNENISGMFIAS